MSNFEHRGPLVDTRLFDDTGIKFKSVRTLKKIKSKRHVKDEPADHAINQSNVQLSESAKQSNNPSTKKQLKKAKSSVVSTRSIDVAPQRSLTIHSKDQPIDQSTDQSTPDSTTRTLTPSISARASVPSTSSPFKRASVVPVTEIEPFNESSADNKILCTDIITNDNFHKKSNLTRQKSLKKSKSKSKLYRAGTIRSIQPNQEKETTFVYEEKEMRVAVCCTIQ